MLNKEIVVKRMNAHGILNLLNTAEPIGIFQLRLIKLDCITLEKIFLSEECINPVLADMKLHGSIITIALVSFPTV